MCWMWCVVGSEYFFWKCTFLYMTDTVFERVDSETLRTLTHLFHTLLQVYMSRENRLASNTLLLPLPFAIVILTHCSKIRASPFVHTRRSARFCPLSCQFGVCPTIVVASIDYHLDIGTTAWMDKAHMGLMCILASRFGSRTPAPKDWYANRKRGLEDSSRLHFPCALSLPLGTSTKVQSDLS